MSKNKKRKRTNPLLFLDVDGVLNTSMDATLSEGMIKRLAVILQKTQCTVCLSTSWRADMIAKESLFEALKEIGDIDVEKVYVGDTPAIYHLPRAYEIAAFLESKYDRKTLELLRWVALDDMPLDKPVHESRGKVLQKCEALMSGHFVQTDETVGLTDHDMKRAIQLLL